uniref:transposase n=1 Tax=Komagataeibacter oboediens TaxID=65958 RepID=UPI0038CFC20B
MKGSRFTTEQFSGSLKEQESGLKVSDLCRRHGSSEVTLALPTTVPATDMSLPETMMTLSLAATMLPT